MDGCPRFHPGIPENQAQLWLSLSRSIARFLQTTLTLEYIMSRSEFSSSGIHLRRKSARVRSNDAPAMD
jgi:hypothetical protein